MTIFHAGTDHARIPLTPATATATATADAPVVSR